VSPASVGSFCSLPVRQHSPPECEVVLSPDISQGCVVVLLRRPHHPTNRKLSEIMTRFLRPGDRSWPASLTTTAAPAPTPRLGDGRLLQPDTTAARMPLSHRVRCDMEERGNR
jgi:hypothetical protein